ncbi:MAG: hypothetical protein RIG82_03230 [Phycisphaeraceae bacterium]
MGLRLDEGLDLFLLGIVSALSVDQNQLARKLLDALSADVVVATNQISVNQDVHVRVSRGCFVVPLEDCPMEGDAAAWLIVSPSLI